MEAQVIGALLAFTLAVAEEPTLDAVLVSVERHLPALVAAEARLAAAEGEHLAAIGGFDPSGRALGWYKQGKYTQGYTELTVEQATPLWGLEVAGGYRLGLGEFATYDGWYDTLDRGELFVDARLPLLYGGLTDKRRTSIAVADAGVDEAAAKLEDKRIELAWKARSSWWYWVAAGARLAVAEELLAVAETNRAAIEQRISRGDLAPIDAVDAQRVLTERRATVVGLQRDLDNAARVLGLYLRDEAGQPAPPLGLRPAVLDTPSTADVAPVEVLLAEALARRPDLDQLDAKQRATQAKLRLARNGVLPKLDLKVGVAGDLAAESEKAEPLDVKVGGELGFTFLQRPARGSLQVARGEAEAIDAEVQWLRDQIAMEVHTAHISALAAHRHAQLTDELLSLALEVEQATRRRYDLGATDLFQVYLREQSRMSAAMSRIKAWADYHVALARLLAVTGQR